MLNNASFAHYYTLHIYLQAFVGMGIQLPENIRRISIHWNSSYIFHVVASLYTNESLFILLTLPTLAQTVQDYILYIWLFIATFNVHCIFETFLIFYLSLFFAYLYFLPVSSIIQHVQSFITCTPSSIEYSWFN